MEPDEYVDTIRRGVAFDYQQKYGESILLFSAAIRSHPRVSEGYLQRCLSHLSINQRVDSVRDVQSAISNCHLSPSEIYVFRGLFSEIRDRDFKRARRNYESATSIDPKNYWAHFSLGYLDEISGDFKSAIRMYTKAYRIGSKFNACMVCHNLGHCYAKLLTNPARIPVGDAGRPLRRHNLKNIRRAETFYKKSLELNPLCFESLLNLGNLYADYLRKFDEALELYDRILSANPKHYGTLITKANVVFYLLHKPEEAIELCEKARSSCPFRSSAYNLLAIIHAFEFGQIDHGLEILDHGRACARLALVVKSLEECRLAILNRIGSEARLEEHVERSRREIMFGCHPMHDQNFRRILYSATKPRPEGEKIAFCDVLIECVDDVD